MILKPTGLIFFLFLFIGAEAQIRVTEIATGNKAHSLVLRNFMGDGVKITRVTFSGNPDALGAFTDQEMLTGFSRGLALGTGRVELIAGRNTKPNTSTNFGNHFFFDEDLVTRSSQCDGAVLTIDFIPSGDSLSFAFIFGSEEYPEFVDKEFNDMFQLLLQPLFAKAKSKNLAILPDKKMVSINNINHLRNQSLYIDNTQPSGKHYPYIEFDGFTLPVYAGTRVAPGKPYRLKIMLVDLEDCDYDSGILLEAYSFRSISTHPRKPPPLKRTYHFNFATNASVLNEKATVAVKKLIDSLAGFSFDSIIITGHTDNEGEAEGNLLLSKKRAAYIADKMIAGRVRCSRFVSQGKGSTEPVVPNNSPKNMAINRRVEIIFYHKAR